MRFNPCVAFRLSSARPGLASSVGKPLICSIVVNALDDLPDGETR
jgi:hypothetical protein